MERGEVEDEILSEEGDKLSLERLEMLRVIGTGTFARVCLCQVLQTWNFQYLIETLLRIKLLKITMR